MKLYKDHCFAICAYGESPYLEACVRSLLAQTAGSGIILATSTPNPRISGIAGRYDIPVYVNEESRGIASDWQYAYDRAREHAGYVTLAHQDDIYLPHYTEAVMKRLEKEKDALFCFTDYAELRNGRRLDVSPYTAVKRLMLLPLLCPGIRTLPQAKRLTLAFGNPIMCPTVTYDTSALPEKLFSPEFKSDLDWDAWERLSRLGGSFAYERHTLFLHRIHKDEATAQLIRYGDRAAEDYVMFLRFWPEAAAKAIMCFYSLGERNYSL